MATLKGFEGNLVDLLNNLIELDYDAIEAYKAAIARMEDVGDKSTLAGFLQDHERHVSDLTGLVERMGSPAKKEGDLLQILTKGKVLIGGLVGDRVVLAAMKTNEDDTNSAYERAIAHPNLTDEVRMVLEKNLADERRHREWIEKRIGEAEGLVKMKKAG
jgi:uncharacterized protein (TIGR02284 family)